MPQRQNKLTEGQLDSLLEPLKTFQGVHTDNGEIQKDDHENQNTDKELQKSLEREES